MQVFADNPMTFPHPGSRYNIPVDKTVSPKVGGFQGKVPNSVAAVTLKAMDLPEIRAGGHRKRFGVMEPRKSRTTRTWRSFTSPAELLRSGHGCETSGCNHIRCFSLKSVSFACRPNALVMLQLLYDLCILSWMKCRSHLCDLSLGGLQQIRRLQSGRAHSPRVA